MNRSTCIKVLRRASVSLLGLSYLLLAPAAHGEQTSDLLARAIDQAVAENSQCIGLAIGVKKGRSIVTRFYGTTGNNGVPTADTEFEIGSISKTFTATLLAWADQKGRMRIEDPLAKFAPSRIPSWQGQPIRLGQLADHTAGLPRQIPTTDRHFGPDDVWSFLAHYQLTRAPGTDYLYSNLSANALGLAIERAHGLSLEQLFAHVITGPLGMPDTAIELSKARHARLAWGYGSNGQRATEYTAGYPLVGGAGGLRSTLRDMMRYLEFELGEVDTPLNSLLPVLHKVRYAAGPRIGVGLAWNTHVLSDGSPIISKGGQEPGFSSSIAFTPATHTGAVVLANQKSCGAPKIGNALIHQINGLNASR